MLSDGIFIDVASERFDDTSTPNFISAGDWNGDGYSDILVNGYRLYRNSGPPDYNYSLQSNVFQSSTAGSVNGVWADYDGDGDLDLYQGCRKDTADRLWENRGPPGFELSDVSADVFGTWKNVGPNTGNAWSDYDGDGDLDIYVGSGEDWNDGDPVYYQDYMLRNENGVSFTDVTSQAGMSGENMYARGTTWGDFDNDGLDDLYVSHYRIRENHLFVNHGDGTFSEEGIERNCSGTHDETWYRDTTAGQLYGKTMWGPTNGHTIGSSWADFNRDGNLDLWTSDFVHKYVGYIGSWYDIRGYVCDDGNLYINDGAPYHTFTDYRNTSGIPIWPVGGQGTYRGDQTFSGVTVGDFDNDGWEDIYIPQVYGDLPYTTPHLFRNLGTNVGSDVPNGTVFEDVTDNLGIVGANTYANLFLDYDNDGDLDLITGGGDTWDSSGGVWTGYRLRLFENQGSNGNKWLRVDLNGPEGNPDAIGARVSIPVPVSAPVNHLMTREVRAGTGHAHQSSPILHFGFGTEVAPENYDSYKMTVYWPDGGVQYVDIEELNTTITVDYPAESFPEINSVSVTDPLWEDNLTKITVDAVPGSGTISRYLWDLDSDNHFDKVTTDNHIEFMVYHSGLRFVRCLVENSNGLGREAAHIKVDPANVPPAVTGPFVSELTGYVDDTADLSAFSVSDSPSDMKNMTWRVSWGDGTFTDGVGKLAGSHIYTTPVESIFSLNVTDGDLWNNISYIIRISNVPPWGYIEPEGGNTTSYYEDEIVRLNALIFDTPSDDTEHMVQWSFDGGITYGTWESAAYVRRSFAETGIHNISARIRDGYDGISEIRGSVMIENPVPYLDVRYKTAKIEVDEDHELDMDGWVDGGDTASDLPGLRYRWDFGDGNVTEWYASPDVYHTYERQGTYYAVCTVIDDDEGVGNASFRVEVSNVPPLIGSIDPLPEVYEDQSFTIEASASDTISDSDSLRYSYDLGDGRVFEGTDSIEVYYRSSGTYSVTVTVFDDDGDSDSTLTTIMVVNRPPEGSMQVEIPSGRLTEDQPVYFRAVDLSDETLDLLNLTVRWNFGDGSGEKSGMSVNHTYVRKGSFRVRMIISDGDDETEKTRNLIVDNVPPTADFTAGSIDVKVGEKVSFDAGASWDTPSDIPYLTYRWDFGDESTGTGMRTNHTYTAPGNYTVKLDVFDDDGAVSQAYMSVMVVGGDSGVASGRDDNTALTVTIIVLVLLILAAVIVAGIIITVRIRRERDSHVPAQLAQDQSRSIPPGMIRPPVPEAAPRPQPASTPGTISPPPPPRAPPPINGPPAPSGRDGTLPEGSRGPGSNRLRRLRTDGARPRPGRHRT
ncbi:MAG: PKD domain-containing protein, partial [Thermoplasmatota archaeon]